MAAKAKARRAVHRTFSDTVVTFQVGKDFMGNDTIHFRFASGEKSSASPKHFFELFREDDERSV